MTSVMPPREDTASILVRVQDELRHLRDQITNNTNCDLTTIRDAIIETERAVQGRAEEYLNAQQNKVLTLPVVGNGGIGAAHLYRGKQSNFVPPRISKIKAGGDFQYSGTKGPGQVVKETFERRVIYAPVHQPNNPVSRNVIYERFGVAPPRVREPLPAIPPIKPITGKMVRGSAALPKQNRLDPRLTPPPITEKDAKKGILSLCERGLIPPAADLTLEPSPIKQRPVQLHEPMLDLVEKIADAQDLEVTMTGVRLDSSVNDSPKQVIYNKMSGLRLNMGGGGGGESGTKSRTSTFHTINTPFTPRSAGHLVGPPQTPSVFEKPSFKFTIQLGNTIANSNDFNAFRKACGGMWHTVVQCLQELEMLLTKYAVPMAIVEGVKLMSLAEQYPMDIRPGLKDLVRCCTNETTVRDVIKTPGQIYRGPNGLDLAASRIQATFKMHLERDKYLSYRKRKSAASVIAMNYIMRMRLINIRNKIRAARTRYLTNFRERRANLQNNWDSILKRKRVIIHLPSLGYSSAIRNSLIDLHVLQNSQMGRICEVNDPLVEVIYISPIDLDEDIQEYYKKLLGMGVSPDGKKLDDATKKVQFVIPDYVSGLPGVNLSLASLLLCSSKSMKRLKSLIAGREALLVPGVINDHDLELADKLDVPVLGVEPGVLQALTHKSGAKRLFDEAGVTIPPSEIDIYSEDQIFEYLAVLIANNLDVKRWIFKIGNEFDARGTAYCEIVDHLACLKWAKKQEAHYGEKWSKRWAQDPAITKIYSELPDILHHNLIVINDTLYPSIETYLAAFVKSGGVIEAWPPAEDITCLTVDMFISPTGNIDIKNTGDQIRATDFQTWALSSPQTSVKPERLHMDCFSVAKCCYNKGVIGYVSVSFATFISSKTLKQELWAIDLKLQYTDTMCMSNILQFVTGGRFDPPSGLFKIPQYQSLPEPASRYKSPKTRAPPNHRFAVLAPRLLHSNLSLVHYSVFFQMCRAHLIGYDIREREGVIFTLLDSYKRDLIGMVTVEPDLPKTLKSFARNLSTIHQEISSARMPGENNFVGLISETEDILQSLGVNLDEEESQSSTH